MLRQRFATLTMAVFTLSALGGAAAHADVRLPALITNNMVIQQKAPVHLWGWADEGEKVTVTFGGMTESATAQNGKWSVTLPSRAKAGGPYTLTIEGKNKIELTNVLVGEVWICSGQSNMEFALKNAYEAQQHISASDNPNIHLFHVAKARSDTPKDDVKATWQACSPQTVGGFSAVGYFFARDLQKARGVPIGMIESDWGGTPAESWIGEPAMTADPILKPTVDAYPAAKERLDKQLAAYPTAVEKAKAEGKPAPRRPSIWRYSELYNGMIAPLIQYPIAGALWYQGESNAGRPDLYRTLLPTLIRSWRQDWKENNFPFLVVQLPPYMDIKPQPVESNWAALREAQVYTSQIVPRVGVAVIMDLGDAHNIHPIKKEPVGERLALLARKIAYGAKIVANGPTYRSHKVEGDKVVISFDNVGGGLVVKASADATSSAADNKTADVNGGKLTGFAIAGADHKYVWADAQIVGDTIVVSSPSVPAPMDVRYGWADFPEINLWNKAGLIASPFRTDAPAQISKSGRGFISIGRSF